MKWMICCASLALAAGVAPSRAAEPIRQRSLTEAEQRVAIKALLADAAAITASEPSCKSDLHDAREVTTTQALGEVLSRAAAEDRLVKVTINCFVRRDYPLQAGEEYCRVGLVPDGRRGDFGYGLAFRMNWQTRSVVGGSVECY